jgi:ankyrin repeat protein
VFYSNTTRLRWNFLSSAYEDSESLGFATLHSIVLGIATGSLRSQLELSTDDIDIQDSSGRTPLWWAVWQEEEPSAKILLEYGANPNIPSLDGTSPLMLAMEYCSLGLIVLLLQSGSSVAVRDHRGTSTLQFWARGKQRPADEDEKIMQLITARGVDLNWADDRSCTALHYTVEHLPYGYTKTTLLLGHGANINAQSRSGHTPLMVAILNDNHAAVRHLIEQGARVDWKNLAGSTILHLAVTNSTILTWWALIKTLKFRVGEIDVYARDRVGAEFYELFWEGRDRFCLIGREDPETEFPVFQELVKTFLGDDFGLPRDAYGNWISDSEEDDEESPGEGYSTEKEHKSGDDETDSEQEDGTDIDTEEEFWEARELQEAVTGDGNMNDATAKREGLMS